MRRDVDRTELPGGSAYNMLDFIPDEVQAVTAGRGGWTYAAGALTAATQIKGLVYAPFLTGAKLLAVDQQPKLWDVLAASSITGTPVVPGCPPLYHRGKVIFPAASGAPTPPTYYDGTTQGTLTASITPSVGTVYKDHTVLANDKGSTTAQRIWFSAAGDPTSYDTSFGWWDTSSPVTALAGLANSILVFHPDSTERLRGTTPPPGSDMTLEPLLPNVGCIDPFSVAYWQNKVIWCSAQGIHMSDGAAVVDLTANAQMKTYWNLKLASYATSWRISGGVYRDHYIVSINNGNTLIDALCVNLQTQVMWRFTNLHGGSFVNAQAGQQEKLYMGQWNAGRVAELSSLWNPSASVKQDGDGTNPAPLVETGMFRGFDRLHRRWIESMGKQKWRWAYVDYDLRDAATDNPTLTLSYCTTPTGAYTATDRTLPETTDVSRVRRALGKTQGGATHSQMMGFSLGVNGPYASAKLLTLEGAFEPIDIGAL